MPLVAELDDRLDHLLLLGLEDALLAAALDEDRQLLGGHHALRLVARTEHSRHTGRDRRQDVDERPENAQRGSR